LQRALPTTARPYRVDLHEIVLGAAQRTGPNDMAMSTIPAE
jgi:hypothetical protein